MTHSDPPHQLPSCELCGGQLLGNLSLAGQVGLHPKGRTLWGLPMSAVDAVVCLGCGHTRYFAADLAKLRQEAQDHPDWFTR